MSWSLRPGIGVGRAVGTEDVKNVVYSGGEVYYLLTADVVEGVYICLVYRNRVTVSSDGVCFPVYIW